MASNLSTEGDRTTEDVKAIAKLVYFITIILGITGNAIVIWVATVRLRAKVTYVWLVNLAIADLVFCITRVISVAQSYMDSWQFGHFLCKVMSFFKYANMFCSVFLLSVISLDRMLCVWRPVFTKQHRTIRVARLISVAVWIVASAMSVPYFISWKVYPHKNTTQLKCGLQSASGEAANSALGIIRLLFGFLLPFLVILSCSMLAAVGIRRARFSGTSRPLRMLIALVAAFFLCWTPYHCFRLAQVFHSQSQAVKVGLTLSKALAYFNSCVNPILHFCMGLNQGWLKKFRNAEQRHFMVRENITIDT